MNRILPILVFFFFVLSVSCDGTKTVIKNDNAADGDILVAGDSDELLPDGDAEKPDTCGNGTVEEGEACDGTGLTSCVEIDPGKFASGKAACKEDCSGWDTATCVEIEEDQPVADDHAMPDLPDLSADEDSDVEGPDHDTADVATDEDGTTDDLTDSVDEISGDDGEIADDGTVIDEDIPAVDEAQPIDEDVAPVDDTPLPDVDIDVYVPTCRNGIVDPGEECDDNNASNTDGCLNDCTLPYCGDGFVRTGYEQCDDGNSIETDACKNDCTDNICGDGILNDGVEECDDNNANNCDACQNDCLNYAAGCGNGCLDDGETCDDGDLNGTYDHCNGGCTGVGPHCGDGIPNGGEDCDDGDTDECDACLNDCTAYVAACGNGCVDIGEDCDDGNKLNGDNCSSNCETETGVVTIGTGTSTQRYPLGSYYGYERSAALYTAAEMGQTGTITRIAWYIGASCATSVPRRILMKTTTASTLTAGTWETMTTGATQVYSASAATATAGDWQGFTLASSFPVPAGQNLIVLVEDNYGATGSACGSSTPTVRYSTVSNRHEYWTANTNPPTGNGTVSNSRPNIQLTLNTNLCVQLNEPCDDHGDDGSICYDNGATYSCDCSGGFTFETDSCYDSDECAGGAGPCDDEGDTGATCQNLAGKYVCYCGDEFLYDGTTCIPEVPDMPVHVTLPHNGNPQAVTLEFDTFIRQADVMILVDQSGSMIGEHDNLKNGINDVVITGVRTMIRDVVFGLVKFGTLEDQPYTLAQALTEDAAAMQTAVDAIADVGGSSEAAYEVLYQAATGEGGTFTVEEGCNGGEPTMVTIPPSEPGWRAGSFPIMIMCTDEEMQSYIDTHTPEQTYAAMNAIYAKFIGIDSGAGGVVPTFKGVADATGSVDLDGNDFHQEIASDGSGLSEAIVAAVEALTTEIRIDVTAEPVGVANLDGVDTTLFVKSASPVSGDPGIGVGYLSANSDTFFGVAPSTRLTFQLLFQNDFFSNTGSTAKNFTVIIRLIGDGMVDLDEREITISVPPIS